MDDQTADQTEFVEELKGRVAFLERELEKRAEEIRRRDAALKREQQLTAMLATRLGELEAPQEGPHEGRQDAVREPAGTSEVSGTRFDAGGTQEGAEHPQLGGGLLAPVDKLPWWHYVLGVCSVFLMVTLAAFVIFRNFDPAAGDTEAADSSVELVEFYAGLWAIPGVFGFWVGFRQKYSRLYSRIIPIGGLLALTVGLGLGTAYAVWLRQQPLASHGNAGEFLLGVVAYSFGFGLPAWLVFVSGYLIGNAWQRRRIRRISGTTPASPLSLAGQGSERQPRKDLTPTQQAVLGWGGTIIGALINLFATLARNAG